MRIFNHLRLDYQAFLSELFNKHDTITAKAAASATDLIVNADKLISYFYLLR